LVLVVDAGIGELTGETAVPANFAAEIEVARAILLRGGTVVYPTETLYGLGVDATNAAALERLVRLKIRETGKPISVLVANRAMMTTLVSALTPQASLLMDAFWPGPLTLVLPARPQVSQVLTGGSGKLGLRISSHPVARELLMALARPLTTPSANPAGAEPPRTVAQARAYFGASVDHYIDAGQLPGEPASTVVDVDTEIRILREGAVSRAQVLAVVGEMSE
jgi:L-threonylcarbamoyladenylate synthase